MDQEISPSSERKIADVFFWEQYRKSSYILSTFIIYSFPLEFLQFSLCLTEQKHVYIFIITTFSHHRVRFPCLSIPPSLVFSSSASTAGRHTRLIVVILQCQEISTALPSTVCCSGTNLSQALLVFLLRLFFPSPFS